MKLSMKLAGLAAAGLLVGIGATGCGNSEEPVGDDISAIETTVSSDATASEQEPTDDQTEQLDECHLRDTDDTLGESTYDVCSIRVQDQTVLMAVTEYIGISLATTPDNSDEFCNVGQCAGLGLDGDGEVVSLSVVCYDGQDTFGVAVPEEGVNYPPAVQYWTSGLVDDAHQAVGFINIDSVVDGDAVIQPLEDALTQHFGDMTDLSNSCGNPRVVHETTLHDMFVAS